MLKGLVSSDIVDRLGASLAPAGWYIDAITGKYSVEGRVFHSPDKPWIYVNTLQKADDQGHVKNISACSVYQAIAETCRFIPSPCLSCWKVVVRPHTFYELMQLYKFQVEFTKDCMGVDRFCKCGIETRAYVHGNYGGYFYCDSLKQGRERYAEVRKAVDKINPDIPMVLKRYCTEFELDLGPSDQYQWVKGTQELEQEIFANIDFDSCTKASPQPDMVVRHILRKWMEFAWDRGDQTVAAFNDDDPLFPEVVTYHEKTGGLK